MSKIEDGNTAIKFPDQHYVNFQSRPSADNVPLGFMTPDGTDKAAQKRKATVDNWAGTYDYKTHTQNNPEGVSYKNEPMVGFKLSREIRRYASFGQGNVKWRIEDPRGFELEISSPNFAQIISLCNLEKGEIMEQCIWGRLGSENVLVPVDSDAYRVAMANTQRIAKKASLKDLKRGDYVIMQNGDEGTFMGVFYFFYGAWSHNAMSQEASDKKRYVFKFKGNNNHYPYFAVATPKLSEIQSGDGTLTQEDAEKELNELIVKKRKNSTYDSGIRETGYNRICGVTSEPPKKSDFIITQTDEVDFTSISHKPSGPYWGMLGARLISFDLQNFHSVSNRNRNGFDKVWITEWDQAKLAQQDPEFVIVPPLQHGGWNQRDDRRTPHTEMPEKVWSYKVQIQTKHSGLIAIPLDNN